MQSDTPAAEARRRILATALRPAWREAWTRGARILGARLVVRSSGVGEDGSERSFAGVHRTVLDVSPEEVPEAVRAVWASAFGPLAEAYGRGRAMAVLLQPLLEPFAAGVVFTVDPRTGSARELVVEAVRGQGEALVSGRAVPQWAVLRRGRPLRVVERDDHAQPVTWAFREGALVGVPVGRGRAGAPLLDERTLVALGRLALRAERALGHPVDVEWAWDGRALSLLQARPITGRGSARRRDVLWTRRFLGERWPAPPTPLTWSILAPLLDHFIGYPDVQAAYLGGGPSIRRHDGHAYLNVTVFRHLLFKWPGAPAPRFMLELLPPEEADGFRRSWRVWPDRMVYLAILKTTVEERRWERFDWDPVRNPAHWDAFVPRLREALTTLEGPALGPRDALHRVQAHVDLLRDYLSIHVCSLLYANLAWQLLEAVVGAWVDGPRSGWMARLAVSEEGNRTLQLNRALHGLVLTEADREALASDEVPEVARAFLDHYGARAEASWEIFSPRWREHPSRILPLLDGRAPEPVGPDPLPALLRSLPVHRRPVLGGLVRYTRRYLLLRENQRFEMDRLMAGLQASLVELGRQVGVPAEDVPFCTLQELAGRVDGSAGPLCVDARRKAHRSSPVDPPVFLRGDEGADVPVGGGRLEGQGISPGRVTGRVRVVGSLAEARHLEAGEVLVAPAVDPGWTPLLGRAGGLVLEMGSLLSHGAVIAREYGVPGVVNLTGVTRILETGMQVTVDGSRGVVWVHGA